VDANVRRGGRQYQQFAAAIERLSWVKYGCDAFYDPVRAEHCQLRFSLLSYRLPLKWIRSNWLSMCSDYQVVFRQSTFLPRLAESAQNW